jgi:outer membrane lipoprotein carrier protein
MRRLLIAVLTLLSPLALGAQAPSRPGADVFAKTLQQRYQGISDFTADFSQSYRGGALKTRTVEEGTVAIKKPGRMRWVYTRPERKEFVSDGTKIYFYIPQDRQVIVSNATTADNSTSSLFLAGKGDIGRDFTASYIDTPVPGTLALKLVPRRKQPDYEYLVIAVDPASLQIRGLVTRDLQGGDSALTFTNLKENRGLSDKEFVFRIPKGVDIVDNAAGN